MAVKGVLKKARVKIKSKQHYDVVCSKTKSIFGMFTFGREGVTFGEVLHHSQ